MKKAIGMHAIASNKRLNALFIQSLPIQKVRVLQVKCFAFHPEQGEKREVWREGKPVFGSLIRSGVSGKNLQEKEYTENDCYGRKWSKIKRRHAVCPKS
jgi:hypothetical protein